MAPAAALGLTLAGVGSLAAWSAGTFDATRLERPDSYAAGMELERLLEQTDALRRSADKYADRVDAAVLAITGLLDERAEPSDARRGPTQRLVLASDLHSNVLTLPTLRRCAAGRLTVLAGDFTTDGGRLEAPLAARLADVGRPVVAVSGNHDSTGVMDALERRGGTVLEHTDGVQRIAGVATAASRTRSPPRAAASRAASAPA